MKSFDVLAKQGQVSCPHNDGEIGHERRDLPSAKNEAGDSWVLLPNVVHGRSAQASNDGLAIDE